ncbi:hypothetical protein BJ741DRAFT_586001 [Chytriomyces cf. hyalinus JEL632]|nr:hypothetical protein BJ741DRAFT_586001 [Chytriomyces cf. hyalinus JEL632]
MANDRIINQVPAFLAGCIFTIGCVVVGLILLFRVVSQTLLAPPPHSFQASTEDSKSQQGHPSYVLDNDGDYEPQLEKTGWLRISNVPLSLNQLYMDSSGIETAYYLGGIGSDTPSTSKQESQPPKTLASSHRQYMLSVNNAFQAVRNMGSAAIQTSSYLVSRFQGHDVSLPEIAEISPTSGSSAKSNVPWKDVFAVIKCDVMFIYDSEKKLECVDVLRLKNYQVSFHERHLQDHELYHKHTPLQIWPKEQNASSPNIYTYIYCQSGSEKEDWFFLLRRATTLQYSECITQNNAPQAQQQYRNSMQKLSDSLGIDPSSSEPQDPATAWINALLGRMFVGFHANPLIKRYLIDKLSRQRHTHAPASPNEQESTKSTAFLSDIEITDLEIGDSLPIISNPRLVEFSLDGDMVLDLDFVYTGGLRVEAATLASISVTALGAFLTKPFEIPITLAVRINRIKATLRLRMKPFHETSRLWVGLHPGLDLSVQVEPGVLNQLLTLQMINSVVEARIKRALEEFIVLPQMDDFGFYPSGGMGGFYWDGHEKDVYAGTSNFGNEGDESHDEFCDAIEMEDNTDLRGSIQREEPSLNPEELSELLQAHQNTQRSSGASASSKGVMTSEYWMREDADDDYDARLVLQAMHETRNLPLRVVGGEEFIEQINEPDRQANCDNQNSSISSISSLPPKSLGALIWESQTLTQPPPQLRKSVFQIAGGAAEYAGQKAREYRLKQISSTVSKSAVLALDVGLGMLGYTRAANLAASRDSVYKPPIASFRERLQTVPISVANGTPDSDCGSSDGNDRACKAEERDRTKTWSTEALPRQQRIHVKRSAGSGPGRRSTIAWDHRNSESASDSSTRIESLGAKTKSLKSSFDYKVRTARCCGSRFGTPQNNGSGTPRVSSTSNQNGTPSILSRMSSATDIFPKESTMQGPHTFTPSTLSDTEEKKAKKALMPAPLEKELSLNESIHQAGVSSLRKHPFEIAPPLPDPSEVPSFLRSQVLSDLVRCNNCHATQTASSEMPERMKPNLQYPRELGRDESCSSSDLIYAGDYGADEHSIGYAGLAWRWYR